MNLFTPSRLRHLRVQVIAFVAITLCLTILFTSTNIGPLLAAPLAAAPLTTNEDTPLLIDTEIAVTPNTSIAIGPQTPAHGSVSVNAFGTTFILTYTPGANQTAPVIFQYQLCTTSPLGCGAPIQVSITITPINDPPVANPDVATVTEDSGATSIDVLANDNAGPLEGTAGLVLVSVSSASHGTAIVNPDNTSQALYTPALNYCGPDSFTYNMRDDSYVVVTGQVTINVTCVNDAPIAGDDGTPTPIAVTEDTPIVISFATLLANDSDPENDTLEVIGATNGTYGTVVVNTVNNRVVYSPNLNYCGPDSFTYTITDGALTDTATVYVEVACVIDPPVLSIDGPNNVGKHLFEIDVVLTSIDENVGGVQFSLDYDELCLTNPMKVPGSVPPSFDPPFIYDTGLQLDIFVTDTDDTFELLAGPAAVTTQRILMSLQFEVQASCPNADDTVEVDFNFLSPLFFDENIQPISGQSIDVDNMLVDANSPPTAINITPAAVDEGTAGAEVGTLSTVDVDLPSDSHTYALVAGIGDTDNSSFEISGSTLKLKNSVTADYESQSSYAVRIRSTDSYGAMREETFTINVTDLNESPIALDDGTPTPIIIQGITIIDVLDNDIDPDGGSISIDSVTNGAHGSVANGSSDVTYTPVASYSGLDSFTYTIIDNGTPPMTDEATVHVVVVAAVARGDCDASGSVNVGDIMAIAREIFDNGSQPWYMAFNNTHAGSPFGCDANGDNAIEIGDIMCTANIIFGRSCVPPTAAASALVPATMAIGANLTAEAGANVRVPILLDSGGNAATAVSFAVNFPATQATFDTTDGDSDGLYDAIELNVSGDLFKYVYYNAEASRLEFVLADITDPFLTLTDGEIAAVTLTIDEDASTADVAITLSHSDLSTESGQLIPVEATDGTVTVLSPGGQSQDLKLFIPMIAN